MSSGQEHEVLDSGDGSTILRRRLPGSGALRPSDEATERVPGSPLLRHLPLGSAGEVRRLAQALGGFVAALSRVPRRDVEDLGPAGQPSLGEYRDEIAEISRALESALTAVRRSAVAAFLAETCPPSPAEVLLAHSDLGA